MKIISLSSNIAGPACSIACCIKKFFYNNNYKTNFFDYLEISFTSILQILRLKENDINYLSIDENNSFINNTDKKTIKFNNFDKIYSHHDLKADHSIDELNNFFEKYKRRYYRLIEYIKNENIIFFIRYGIEDESQICEFIEIIKELNQQVKVYFINIYENDNINKSVYNKINNLDNFIEINYNYHIDKNRIYSKDLFYRLLEYDWSIIYKIICKKLEYANANEKDKLENLLFNG
jgi:hypothetical protein